MENYDWDSWYTLVRTLAPDASIAVTGPKVRWVGNEGSRAALVAARPKTDYLPWWPAERDVSIRDGWLYHADQQPQSVDELTGIYFGSVGRDAVLLLNVPPDTDGLLHATDVARGARRTVAERRVTLDLGRELEVDRIRLAEDIRYGHGDGGCG
ncbi:hypothetical protein [Streptomyces sp. NPDC056660]|uniref:hypothetical protein n=1 Tax=Streptomyces sp. NPDC056660 TaxID=3345897 RepID=UPI00368FD6FE